MCKARGDGCARVAKSQGVIINSVKHSLFAYSLIRANEEGGTALHSALLCWVPPSQGRSINFPHILLTISASGECCKIGYYANYIVNAKREECTFLCVFMSIF